MMIAKNSSGFGSLISVFQFELISKAAQCLTNLARADCLSWSGAPGQWWEKW